VWPEGPEQATEIKSWSVAMGTTTSIERERALAWIARQMSWERTLTNLRRGGTKAAKRHAA
jgi:hypothetical protein